MGLFTYLRLLNEISSSPGIFQRIMGNLLAGVIYAIVRLDGILVSGKKLRTSEEHGRNTEMTLQC